MKQNLWSHFQQWSKAGQYCDCAWGPRPTSVRVGPLGGHGRPLTVVPHPLRASLQLLQPNPQLPLLPAQAALQLLRALVLLLQLLKGNNNRQQHGILYKGRRYCGFSGKQHYESWFNSPNALIQDYDARWLCLPLCEAGLVSAGWGWCSSSSRTTGGLASWAAPGRASAELVYTTTSSNWCC